LDLDVGGGEDPGELGVSARRRERGGRRARLTGTKKMREMAKEKRAPCQRSWTG
jgi:hypothetical protein